MSPFRSIFLIGIFSLLLSGSVLGQKFSFSETSLLTVIEHLETETPYRFLYREALIAPVKVTLNADSSTIIKELQKTIEALGIGLKVDESRKQVLLFTSDKSQQPKKMHLSGFIVDAISGERLPFSTISWRENGALQGVFSDSSGSFTISRHSTLGSVTLLISYIGYESTALRLDLTSSSTWSEITIRLNPKPYGSSEIIVREVNFYTSNDTVLFGLMKTGAFSPLGETNAVRSLQSLPSVSMNAAINEGLNIRGSSADGFQVLLDGQTVYSQSHLFGLLDAMNSEVLKSSGFYYDITPARFQAPLGGTLSLITKTGSVNETKGSVGFTNTAVKSTLEGPILKGRASWLLSGRFSYLDEINWFNNADMIEFGLDVNRPAELLFEPKLQLPAVREVRFNQIEVENTDAQFYDLHAKLYAETKNGSLFTLSGYYGSDTALQEYFRDENAFISFNETRNSWENLSLTSTMYHRLSSATRSESRIGYTSYSSFYNKDDFEYPVRVTARGINLDSVLVQPLTLSNSLQQFDAYHSFFTVFDHWSMEYGISYSNFDLEYQENSLARNSFLSRRTSQLVDLFHQTDLTLNSGFKLNLGNRLHYFSNGQYLRWSPRLKVSYAFSEGLTTGIGYSKNHQFINRLQFYNINSNDFWILANEDQPPSSVNYFSSGVYYQYNPNWYVQAEAYVKDFQNIRLHELNTGLISESFKSNETPWFDQNEGLSRGVEVLVKNRVQRLSLTTAYTYSVAEIRNERINNGNYFYANWDRRHQVVMVSEIPLEHQFTIFLSWNFGTGSPNRLDIISVGSSDRLPNYSRADLSLAYQKTTRAGKLDAHFSIYNVLNRENPWYAERRQVSVTTRNRVFQGNAISHVFDLGIQPSFSLSWSF